MTHISKILRGGIEVSIETLWLIETEKRILLVRASSAAEAARLSQRDGYSAALRVSKYGFNLTQEGVVFSCFSALDKEN